MLWVLLLVIFGCAPRSDPQLLLPGAPAATVSDLLARYPLADGQTIRADLLGATTEISYHLVQMREGDGERPHLHASHDLVVMVLRGQGSQSINGWVVTLRPGDSAIIRAGTPHHFVNTGDVPAAALTVFSPPFDGTDQLPLSEVR